MGKRVLGPEQPLVARVRNYYIQHIIIKIERQIAVQKVKEVLKSTLLDFNAEKLFKGVLLQVDVDPS